jgi:hypothetical protein
VSWPELELMRAGEKRVQEIRCAALSLLSSCEAATEKQLTVGGCYHFDAASPCLRPSRRRLPLGLRSHRHYHHIDAASIPPSCLPPSSVDLRGEQLDPVCPVFACTVASYTDRLLSGLWREIAASRSRVCSGVR